MHLRRLLFAYVFFVNIFFGFALNYDRKEILSLNCDFSLGTGYANFYELVYNNAQLISKLSWKNKPSFFLHSGVDFNLKKGLHLFLNTNFFPRLNNSILVDKDYKNNVMFSYSKHWAKTENSVQLDFGFGWKFFIKKFYAKDILTNFFIEPAFKFDFFHYGFSAHDGVFINVTDKFGLFGKFKGEVAKYKLNLFAFELLLNFYAEIEDCHEICIGLGFSPVINALAYDFHILRKLKFYDKFDGRGILLSANANYRYLITNSFGFLTDWEFYFSHSKHGATTVIDKNNFISHFGKGSSGLKLLKTDFTLGVFFNYIN